MEDIILGLLVKTSVSLSVPLSIIFNHSFNTAFVPDDWKKAYVSAKFKKRDKENPGNYRPISLTFQVCKVFESMLRDSIVDHLKENKLIHDSQHGFMKNRSCVTNLLQFLETVTDYIDKGYTVDLIYLDFDKVPHHRLIQKLTAHGIGGKVWISEAEELEDFPRVCLRIQMESTFPSCTHQQCSRHHKGT